MSETDRLHQIIDVLPPHQVQALLALLDAPRELSDEEFLKRLAEAPEEEIDEETAIELRASLADPEPSISHEELKRRLGL